MKQILPKVSGNVFFLSCISFLNDVGGETIKKLIPLYLSTVLGVKPSIIGIIEGVADAVPQLFQPLSGYISDRTQQRKPFVIVGQLLRSCVLGLAVVSSWYQILFLRFLDRSGKGIANAPRDALLSDSSAVSQRGRAFGINRAFDNAGAVVGFLVTAVVFFLLGVEQRLAVNLFQTIVLCASVPLSIATVIAFFFVKEKRKVIKSTRKSVKLPKTYWYILSIVLLFTLGNSSDAFLVLQAQQLGATLPLLFLFLAFYSAVSSVGGYVFSSLSDRVGRKKVILVGWGMYSLVYLLFSQATSVWSLTVLFLMYGVYLGLTEGSIKAWIADVVPQEKRGTAYGIFQMSTGFMLFPASLLVGILWQHFGLSTALLVDAAIAFLAMLLLLTV